MRRTGIIVGEYPLVECPVCGTLHNDRRPPPMELKAIYDQLITEGEYAHHRAQHEALKAGRRPTNFTRRRLLCRIEGLVSQRNLVEVGGGTGLFGVEAHDWAGAIATMTSRRPRWCFVETWGWMPVTFHQGLSAIYPAGLRRRGGHVGGAGTRVGSVGVPEAVRVALRPGGLLVMSTPNYLTPALRDPQKWGILSKPPVHLNFFMPSSLERVLRAAGFSSVSVVRMRLYRPGPGLAGVVRSFRFLIGLDEPKTLHGMARVH